MNPWEQIEITDWQTLTVELERFRHLFQGSEFIFRGQSNAEWPLATRLARILADGYSPETVLKLESEITAKFQREAHHYFDAPIIIAATHDQDWWSLMRHHYCPTRLLDWSFSPYVALYFAVRESPGDAALWALSTDSIEELPNENFGPSQPTPKLWSYRPGRLTKRMIAQRAIFTLSDDLRVSHDELIEPHKRYLTCRKLLIPQMLKGEFFSQLEWMNINASTLFPGVDGLGKSIDEEVEHHGKFFDGLVEKMGELARKSQ